MNGVWWDFGLIPPLLIGGGGDQTISISNNCGVLKTCYTVICYRNFACKCKGPPLLFKLHAPLCCKHINNFKCIRLSILHYSFSKRNNFCTNV